MDLASSALSESANPDDGESPTDFKKDLVRNLSKYEQPALTQWIHAVQMTDFSDMCFSLLLFPEFTKLTKPTFGDRGN